MHSCLGRVCALLGRRSPLLRSARFRRVVLRSFVPLFVSTLPARLPRRSSAGFLHHSQLIGRTGSCVRSGLSRSLALASLYRTLNADDHTLYCKFRRVFNADPVSCLGVLQLGTTRRLLGAANRGAVAIARSTAQFNFYRLKCFSHSCGRVFNRLPSRALERHRPL